jgi:hypothetical protein
MTLYSSYIECPHCAGNGHVELMEPIDLAAGLFAERTDLTVQAGSALTEGSDVTQVVTTRTTDGESVVVTLKMRQEDLLIPDPHLAGRGHHAGDCAGTGQVGTPWRDQTVPVKSVVRAVAVAQGGIRPGGGITTSQVTTFQVARAVAGQGVTDGELWEAIMEYRRSL